MKAKPQKSKSEKLKGPDCPEQGNVDNQGYMEITRPAVICSDPDQLVQFVFIRLEGFNIHGPFFTFSKELFITYHFDKIKLFRRNPNTGSGLDSP